MRFRFERDQHDVVVRVGTFEAAVRLHRIDLPVYDGPGPVSAWRKPVVGPPRRPFAEVQVVDGLEADGWTAAWVYRAGKFLTTWEPRTVAEFPETARSLEGRIRHESAQLVGCWDVFAWRDGECLFAELKRGGSSDRIRKSQLLWRGSAIRLGVSNAAFVIVEWFGSLA